MNFVINVQGGDDDDDRCVTHRLLHAHRGGSGIVEGAGTLLAEGRSRLHVEVSSLLKVWLRLERHWSCIKLRVDGLCEWLWSHVEILLGAHGVLIHVWCHRPHGGLEVVLGSKSD